MYIQREIHACVFIVSNGIKCTLFPWAILVDFPKENHLSYRTVLLSLVTDMGQSLLARSQWVMRLKMRLGCPKWRERVQILSSAP